MPSRERGDEDLFDFQLLDADAGKDDVGDGIERTDFMESDGFRGNAVDFSLGHGNALEDGEGVLTKSLRSLFSMSARISAWLRPWACS